jgi:hypothetical protein
MRDIFALLAPILNAKSYASTEWRDTKIHLGGMNTISILMNMKYEKVTQKQYKKVKTLHDKLLKYNIDSFDKISASAGIFWAYATAWL